MSHPLAHRNGAHDAAPADPTEQSRPSGSKESQNGQKECPPTQILALDIGGTKVKMLFSGENEPRKIPSGKKFTPGQLVESVKELAKDWPYEAISIGFPGLVGDHGPRSEPGNLGPGWVGFNFAAAFGKPVRIINDAAMQALGSYEGGKMLFLGLGTGLGSALISEKVIVPLELGGLLYRDGRRFFDVVGRKGLQELGKDAWRTAVAEMVTMFAAAMAVDYVVLGGGNAKHIKQLPPTARLGNNLTAFRGGFRLWNVEDVPTITAEGVHNPCPTREPADWRYL